MKKFLVVLTILVLVAGFAFAKVTGSVEAKYDFDFSNGTVNYGVDGTNGKISFTLSTDSGSSTGETKPYATATVALTYGGEIKKMGDSTALTWDDGAYVFPISLKDYDDDPLVVKEAVWALKLTDFRIVGENWELNFLKALGVGDYAKSAWEKDSDEKALNMKWAFGDAEGITVTYDDYKVGVYAKVDDADNSKINFRAESKEFTFAEGVNAQAGVAVGYSKTAGTGAFNFGVSVKGSYATDKLSASAAVDMQSVSEKFDLDAAVNVTYAPVTFDAYFATSVKAASVHSWAASTKDILSIKAVVDVESIAKNVPIKVTVLGEDLLNDDRLLAVKEEGKFGKISEEAQFGIFPSLGKAVPSLISDKMIAWFANAGAGYEIVDNLDATLNAGYFRMGDGDTHISWLVFKLGAKYTHELFTAEGGFYLGKGFVSGSDGSELLPSFKATISSKKIVENATLSASLILDEKGAVGMYDSTVAIDDLVGTSSAPMATDRNALVLSCKVEF